MACVVATSKEHIAPITFKKVKLRLRDVVLLARVREKRNHYEWSFRTENDAQRAMIAFSNSRIASVRRIR